jgi:methylated-DNA-[protein]-cysteine S-methyltransferase
VVRVAGETDEAAFYEELAMAGLLPAEPDDDGLRDVAGQLAGYFSGRRRSFDLPIDLNGLSPFQREVLMAVKAVPYGEVRSYGEIARDVGRPGAARAVGSVMAINPVSLIIPCHRIIRGDGTPGLYGRTDGDRGVRKKLWLLALEGVTFGEPLSGGRGDTRGAVAGGAG